MTEIEQYIRSQRQLGFSFEVISQTMIESGWQDSQIRGTIWDLIYEETHTNKPTPKIPFLRIIIFSVPTILLIIGLMVFSIDNEPSSIKGCTAFSSLECSVPTRLVMYLFLTVPLLIIFIPAIYYFITIKKFGTEFYKVLIPFIIIILLLFFPLLFNIW